VENRTEELNDIAPASPKTPEQIEQQMLQTRESLTDKVSALESQVVGSVKTAADTLTGTVDAVKSLMDTAPAAVGDSMKQAADAVGDKMKEVFDMSGHVQNHPWKSVAVSAVTGFITGLLVFRDRAAVAGSAPAAPVYMATPPAASSPSPVSGLFNDLLAMVGQKVKELAETAIDSASTAANQTVRDSVPKLMDAATESVGARRLNGVTHR
jgi:ElaB/YqjD/DUF883 family membrane-anchored ribosome-binding protein